MSGGTSDRNLLVGMLAFQNGFVHREQLLSGMSAWLVEKETPLDEILLRQGALEPDSRTLLLALVEKHLAMHDNVAERSLAAISSVGSVRDELRSLADPDLNASLVHVAAAGAGADHFATVAPTVGAPTSEGGRFRILRPHARGGLGEVHVALDTELNREVALKEIQARHADHPQSRARFTLEAEITGGLEHPSIVPVYGLGTYADGRPYYAMRFIRGDSLAERINSFHRTDWNGKDRQRSLEMRKLLARFIDVCEAIQYAHDRGVLHRDLKPGNIMLGKYGETLVVDWGLAKPLGHSHLRVAPHDASASTLADEAPLVPVISSGSTPTEMGDVVGTPAYMSPEQAGGRLDQLGPASDVYSLGATLYALLTGRPPFDPREFGTAASLLQRVAAGDVRSPRQVSPVVPKPLEAICLKAMALKPVDRYATPDQLRDDLEHWLADEPVSAVNETLVERAGRVVRKHRSLALATAGAVMLIALIATGSALAINQQREENAALATSNLGLAQAEKLARQKSEQRRTQAESLANEKQRLLLDMRTELAKSAFSRGLIDYEAGRLESADENLVRATALLPRNHELRDSFEQVTWDRVTRGSRTLALPLRHQQPVVFARFSYDGKRVVTASWDHTAQLWDVQTGVALGKPMRHLAGIVSAMFSPDGKYLVTASMDLTARVWEVQTGVAVAVPMRHEHIVLSAEFSPDGLRVVTASEDHTVCQWNAKTGAAIGEPIRHGDVVNAARYSPDGQRLVTASADHTAQVWDVQTGAAIGTPMRHHQAVASARFSPNGRLVVTASGDHTAQVWDSYTGAALGPPLRHQLDVTSAVFSPDGQSVVTTSLDYAARAWKASTGEPTGEPMRHLAGVVSAAFSFDGQYVVTGSLDYTSRLWDVQTGAAVGEPLRHLDLVYDAQFSPDGTQVVTASGDSTARVWRAPTTGALVETLRHNSGVLWAEFSPDGKRVITASDDRTARVWDATTGAPLGEPLRHEQAVVSAHFSPDSSRVVTASHDHSARVWDAQTSVALSKPLRHESAVVAGRFSPDGRLVVTASDDGTARVWNVQTADAVGKPMHHKDKVVSAQFSPDGRRVITASRVDTVHVWDAYSGEAIGKPIQHSGGLVSAEFSPDGKLVVTACWDGTARLWNAQTGAAIGAPMRHQSGLVSAHFSRDGSCVVTASHDQTARVWSAASGAPISEPMRHQFAVRSAKFSPDGKRVVTASDDHTARVWDAKTGASLGVPMRHQSPLTSAQFSPDGKRLVTASSDHTARLWEVRSSDPNAAGMATAIGLWSGMSADEQGRVRSLTYEEWTALAAEFFSRDEP